MVKPRSSSYAKSPCDLLLTDLEMPNLDGLSLVSAVRDLPMHRFLPVLVLSCRQPTEFQPENRQGVTGWLVKRSRASITRWVRSLAGDDGSNREL